jgi:hypothetical protein
MRCGQRAGAGAAIWTLDVGAALVWVVAGCVGRPYGLAGLKNDVSCTPVWAGPSQQHCRSFSAVRVIFGG